jgi:signal transduction histidine kinase
MADELAQTLPLRPVSVAGGLSLILFTLSAVFAFIVLWRVVPDVLMWPPAIMAALVLPAWAIFMLYMALRRPSAGDIRQIWSPVTRGVVLGSHILCVWLIWGVMVAIPADRADVQFMLVGFLLAYIPVQIICTPENTILIRFGIFTVLGSLTVFMATRGTTNAMLMAVYLCGFGTVMFFLSDVMRRTVHSLVEARIASDDAAQMLERLVAAVAEERDAKTRFISAASHDLGQPLQAATLFFDQVMRAGDETLRSQAAAGVQRAFAATEQLLSHMLNHLRLEADAVEPRSSRIALGPFLTQVTKQYAPVAAVRSIAIRAVASNSTAMVDPVLLGRAIGNLVSNAIEHSGGTRVVLGVRRRDNAMMRIWVIDNGTGVSRADARHIFDDYYRGLASARLTTSGFGLGLASVRRIAVLIGGETGRDPRWLRGAAFYLDVPNAASSTSNRSNLLSEFEVVM